MTEQKEKEIANFIAQNTEKGRHLESGQDMWGIRDIPYFVNKLMEFLETKKNVK